jgi:hypothetical protein
MKEMRTPAFTGPNGFLDSVDNMEQYLQGADHPVVWLRLRELPPGIPYALYLVNGTWNGEIAGVNLQPAQLQLSLDGKVLPLDLQGTFQLTNVAQGWHRVEVKALAGVPPELTSIKFSLLGPANVGNK